MLDVFVNGNVTILNVPAHMSLVGKTVVGYVFEDKIVYNAVYSTVAEARKAAKANGMTYCFVSEVDEEVAA